MYWSRIKTDSDNSSPTPLNNATLTNVSMLATNAAEARGRILAIAAVMSSSKANNRATALSVCPGERHKVQAFEVLIFA
jgi:hypothetical protein